MDKINWKEKLTSRKFWAAVIGFVTAICAVFGVGQLTLDQIIALITAVSILIAYIVGEGLVDAAREKSIQQHTYTYERIPADIEKGVDEE